MKKVYLFLTLLILFLMACGSSADVGGDIPAASEPVPTLAEEAEIPRIEETPDPGLPPTWTPVPAGGGGGGQTGGGTDAAVPVTGTRTIHVVQRGDTLGIIADRYGVTVSELARINNIQNIDIIEVGQELVIPATSGGN